MNRFSLPLAFVLPLAAAPLFAAPPVTSSSLTPVSGLAKAKTVQVTETVSVAGQDGVLKPYATFKVLASKPGMVRVEGSRAATPTAADLFIVDGTTQYEYAAQSKQYLKSDAPKTKVGTDSRFGMASIARVSSLLDPAPFAAMKRTTEGTPLAPIYSSDASNRAEKLTVDAKTGLPSRLSVYGVKDGKPVEALRYDFTNWTVNKPVAATAFAWTPPADAKVFVEPVQPKLLAVGTSAPDFTVNDKTGKPVKLSDYKGKVVVLDFWATWCGPCMASLPHTTEVAKKYADKNVVVLAVNTSDSQKAFDEWLPKHPEYGTLNFAIDTAPPATNIASTLYHVSGIPTQYIIDKDGKIVKSIVGFGGPDSTLEDAIKAAGASS